MYLPNVETLGHHFNAKYYVFRVYSINPSVHRKGGHGYYVFRLDLLIMEHLRLHFDGKYYVFTMWYPEGMTLMANIMYLLIMEHLNFNDKYYVFTNYEAFKL